MDRFSTVGPDELYLDSATTSIMPDTVLHSVQAALRTGSTPARSSHRRGETATNLYSSARSEIAEHLGARHDEIAFAPSTTAGLSLIANGWALDRLGRGDEVLLSMAEHNSNFLPWHRVCQRTGAQLRSIGLDARGDLDLADLESKLSARTRVVAFCHVSNVTGSCTDIAAAVSRIRSCANHDALIVIDGAQAPAHVTVRPPELGCDFYVFSGHKCYGPPGAAVIWSSERRWEQTDPLWIGGGSVERAQWSDVVYRRGPARFEAGTANLPAVVGLAKGLNFARAHVQPAEESALAQTIQAQLEQVAGVTVLANPAHRVGVVSWVHESIHAHDIGTLLDDEGIRVRAGHHCAQRLLAHFGVSQCVRASLSVFNRLEDIPRLIAALENANKILV